jgi:DNA gyrase subunit A
MIRIHVGDVPAMSEDFEAGTAIPAAEFLGLKDERLVGVFDISGDQELFLGTRSGVVKRVAADYPSKDDFELISLKEGDEVVGASYANAAVECIFVTSDAQLLRFDASAVRAQGRAAGGVAGINLSANARVIYFTALTRTDESMVITAANSSDALPGTDGGSVKISPLSEFPAKGRATGGVRAHKFVRNEDQLFFAAVADSPLANAKNGTAVELPQLAKRDASGTPAQSVIAAVGTR